MTATELWSIGVRRRLQRQRVAGLEHDGQVGLFVEPDSVSIGEIRARSLGELAYLWVRKKWLIKGKQKREFLCCKLKQAGIAFGFGGLSRVSGITCSA